MAGDLGHKKELGFPPAPGLFASNSYSLSFIALLDIYQENQSAFFKYIIMVC